MQLTDKIFIAVSVVAGRALIHLVPPRIGSIFLIGLLSNAASLSEENLPSSSSTGEHSTSCQAEFDDWNRVEKLRFHGGKERAEDFRQAYIQCQANPGAPRSHVDTSPEAQVDPEARNDCRKEFELWSKAGNDYRAREDYVSCQQNLKPEAPSVESPEQIQAREVALKSLADEQAKFVKTHKECCTIGMTKRQFLNSRIKADVGWALVGEPEQVNRTVTGRVVYEQWVYRDGTLFFYFENGVLTSFQD